MDDIGKFIEFYKQFGIALKVKTEFDGRKSIIMRVVNYGEDENVSISDKFCGYVNCYTEVYFDSNGKFIQQGIWQDILYD